MTDLRLLKALIFFALFTGIVLIISLAVIYYTPYVSIKEERQPTGEYCIMSEIIYKGRTVAVEGYCNRTKCQIDSIRPSLEKRLNNSAKQLK